MTSAELKIIQSQSFTDARITGGGMVLEGFEVSRTTTLRGKLYQTKGPASDLVVRNTIVRDCKLDDCTVQGVFFDEVVVENLSISPLLHLYACAFRHVTLRGKIGPLMTVPPHSGLPEDRKDMITAGIVEMYREIDWALDIREAEFIDADFYYVPGDLVRRDPATQFLLRRDSFKDVDVAALPSYANIAAKRFRATPFDSLVAIAPKRSKNFEKALDHLTYLRNTGLAE